MASDPGVSPLYHLYSQNHHGCILSYQFLDNISHKFQAQLYTILDLCRAFDRVFKEHLDGGLASSSFVSLFLFILVHSMVYLLIKDLYSFSKFQGAHES